MTIIYQYISIHVPTSRRFRREVEVDSEVDSYVHFLKLLTLWNQTAYGRWIYFPAGGIHGCLPQVGATRTIEEIVL